MMQNFYAKQISAILLVVFICNFGEVNGFTFARFSYPHFPVARNTTYDTQATTISSTCPCLDLNTSQCQVTCSDCSKKCDLNNVRNKLVTQLNIIRSSITPSSPIYTEINNEQQYLSTVVVMPQSVTNYYICSCKDTNVYPCNDVCNGCTKTTGGKCLIGQVCDHVKATVVSVRGLLPAKNSSQTITDLYDNVDRYAAICAGSYIGPSMFLVAILVIIGMTSNDLFQNPTWY